MGGEAAQSSPSALRAMLYPPMYAAPAHECKERPAESPTIEELNEMLDSAVEEPSDDEAPSMAELNQLAQVTTDYDRMATRYSRALSRLKDALALERYGSSNLRGMAASIEADEAYHMSLLMATYRVQDEFRARSFERRRKAAVAVQKWARGHRARLPALFADRWAARGVLESRLRTVRRRAWWFGIATFLLVAMLTYTLVVLYEAIRREAALDDDRDRALETLSVVRKEAEDRAVAFDIRMASANERQLEDAHEIAALRVELNATHVEFRTFLQNVVHIQRTWPAASMLLGLDAERILRLDHCAGCRYSLEEDLSRHRRRDRRSSKRRDADRGPDFYADRGPDFCDPDSPDDHDDDPYDPVDPL